MTKKYLIKYNFRGEPYFTMNGYDYVLSEYYYDRLNWILYIDYQAYEVIIEYGIDNYIILKEVKND